MMHSKYTTAPSTLGWQRWRGVCIGFLARISPTPVIRNGVWQILLKGGHVQVMIGDLRAFRFKQEDS